MKKLITLLILFLVFVPTQALALSASEINSQINSYRSGQGLSTLSYSADATNSAKARGLNMQTFCYWSHTGPNGETFNSLITYPFLWAGENLARDFNTAQSVITGWINSPTHKAILDDTRPNTIGTFVFTNQCDGKIYVVSHLVQISNVTSLEVSKMNDKPPESILPRVQSSRAVNRPAVRSVCIIDC